MDEFTLNGIQVLRGITCTCTGHIGRSPMCTHTLDSMVGVSMTEQYLNVCHFGRQNEAFVVAMDHRQDSQGPGGDAPGVLVDVALLVGLRVIVNLDNEGG